jgi:hypothetical protein
LWFLALAPTPPLLLPVAPAPCGPPTFGLRRADCDIIAAYGVAVERPRPRPKPVRWLLEELTEAGMLAMIELSEETRTSHNRDAVGARTAGDRRFGLAPVQIDKRVIARRAGSYSASIAT